MTQRKKVGRDLTQGSVLKNLMLFALPIILTNLIQQLYSMVDLMVIGQYVGNAGTSGVSIGGEVSDFLTPVATAFATAGQIVIAQLAGAKRHEEQREVIGSFLTLMMAVSFGFTVLILLLRAPLLSVLNCPPEAYGQAMDYLVITACGLPFIFGYNAVCGILRGMGDSRRPLLFISVAATANIVLDLLLVAVFRLEAAGTAIATVASQLASFIAAFVCLYRNKEAFRLEFNREFFHIRKDPTVVILKLGLPQACRTILVRFSMLWVNANVNAYGLVESSTNAIGNKLQKFLEIYSQSLSQAGGAMVGQNLGAKAHDRAKKTVYWTCLTCLIFATFVSILVYFFPKQVFGIFTNDPAVLEMGVDYLYIMIIHFYASAVTSSFQCMVIGAGNATLNFIIGIMDGIICKIGLSLIFLGTMNLGVYSYFWGTALSRIIPGIICIIYFIRGTWKNANVLRAKKA
ncbi:MAG: MATE family efflux transporter [Clostridia bacterium]|nr:MATE family efflux transporter [Clostridia bacterium]